MRHQKTVQIKRLTEDVPIYGTYIFRCGNSVKIFLRQLATEQLDFRLRFNLSHNTRYLGLYTGLIGGNIQLYQSCRWKIFTAKQTGEVQIKRATIMENPSLLRYTTYYKLQTCAIGYFPLLR